MPEVQTRRGSVSAASDALTFESSLSSEEPVQRWGALEVLDHVPGAVDLARAKDGLPLLLNHDQNQLVGRVENVRLENRKLRGTLRFYETQAGQDARRLLQGGHREVSIGYHILEHRNEQRGAATVVRVSRWAVLEASIVAVPADPSIGVQRSAQLSISKGLPTMESQIENGTAQDGAPENQLSRSQRRAANGSQQDELHRRDEILGYAKHFGKDGKVTIEDAQRAIAEGHSVDQFRQLVLSRIETRHTDTRGFLNPGRPAAQPGRAVRSGARLWPRHPSTRVECPRWRLLTEPRRAQPD
jgi:HK97 family phage prohead protease